MRKHAGLILLLGCALLPRLAIDPTDRTTRTLTLGPDVPPRVICLAWHRDRYRSPAARAFVETARSVCAELHSGFQALRAHLPMNVRSSFPNRGVTPEVQTEINRVMAIWRDCRKRFGEGNGDFLFGRFGIADATYAPVVTRFRTYKVELEREADAYCDAIMAFPAMQEWIAAARHEPMIIDNYEF